MIKIDDKFLSAIDASFKAYNKKGGARSTKKLIPIHKFISETVLNKLGKNFTIKSLGIGDGKEATLDGKYYFKDLDIAIFKKEKSWQLSVLNLSPQITNKMPTIILKT